MSNKDKSGISYRRLYFLFVIVFFGSVCSMLMYELQNNHFSV